MKGLHEVEGLELVYPDEKLTRRGLVSDEEDAERTIQLFKEKDVAGIIIGTMTFGDEVAAIKVAQSLCDLDRHTSRTHRYSSTRNSRGYLS